MKSDRTKEIIMQHAIELIQNSNGLIENITMREIAKHAGVSLGLINHYFGTKENLIEQCVQRIIETVIDSFQPGLVADKDPVETTKRVAKLVMDFLMANPEIAKISILGDLKHPGKADNTMGTVHGFERRLSGDNAHDPRSRTGAFMITAVMQVAFLRKEVLRETIGIDFSDKAQRDACIDDLVERFR